MSHAILYIGDDRPSSTSRNRADALIRIGCRVYMLNPYNLIAARARWQYFFDYRTGFVFLQRFLLREIKLKLSKLNFSPDVIWINSGELLGPLIIKWLRTAFKCKIVLYQNDDPTGNRDGNRFLSLRSALPLYDMCVFVRPETSLEALAMRARKVLRVFTSYDEILHNTDDLEKGIIPDHVVSFVGTLIPQEPRDTFLVALMSAGLPLRLVGDRWRRSKLWHVLKSIYLGTSLSGSAYSQALGKASVSLGFLSHQNRDLITRRSVEILACGGLLCAERTSEHQLLYEDGVEAVFWSSVKECATICLSLLEDLHTRNMICRDGCLHVNLLGVGNEDICHQILEELKCC